ncbi:MAG TPA: 50S ribosomal protein L11 methyltransferase [Levilinea sp.]|nr:50S ribosomal protein L11 methyltransferase [Levilinea sp.]
MAEAHWIEISMTVDPELAEAIAEVLSRFVVNGVAVERDVVYNDAEDAGTPAGPIRVYGYISTKSHAAEKRKQIEEALWHLSQIQPLPEPTFRTLPDEDWMAVWKQHYHPIPVGERLLVLPAWVEKGDPARISVHIDPSMAFGTGTHPSTQLCMELLEKYVRPDQPVIDVGCGSGILSIAALKLGASQALAVDIDQEALRATGENAARNGVLERVEIESGSVKEIDNQRFSITHAPLVVANILASVIMGLFNDGLSRLVEQDGVLIMAGILEEQADLVEQTAREHGMEFVERRSSGDWVALAYRRGR